MGHLKDTAEAVMTEKDKATKRMQEIQDNIRSLCAPGSDEYHKTTNVHGFTTIIIPKSRRRR